MSGPSGTPARGALLNFPKRKLSPLRRACLSLGLPVDVRPGTNLARLLHKIRLGKTAIDYLRFSKDEAARRIVALHDALNATERKAVTIDYLILAAGADVHHISGVVQEEVSRLRGFETSLLLSSAMPEVAKATIEAATREVPIVANVDGKRVVVGHTHGNIRAIEMILKSRGILPIPKGSQIPFLQNLRGERQEKPLSTAPRWKTPEERLREIQDATEPRTPREGRA